METDSLDIGSQSSALKPLFPWLASVPVFFLGLGLYRAWIEIVFVGSFISFPAGEVANHDIYDLVMIATMFVLAAVARRRGPLFNRVGAYIATAVLLSLATICMFASFQFADYVLQLGVVACVSGGVGTAFIIMFWSELYGCLNPFRVALYYCLSMIVAALIIYLCRGLLLPWLAAVSLLLPLASLAWVAASFRTLPANELPRKQKTRFSFPWKITLLMAIYAFAYGLRESCMYQTGFGPHSGFAVPLVSAFVCLGVLVQGGKFNFATTYRIALPLMVAAFLVLPGMGSTHQSVSGFFACGSYTAFSILIMLVLANLSYRYGVSAVWLFGIERGVRALFMLLGRQTEAAIGVLLGPQAELILSVLVVTMVVLGTVILLSERDLSSNWGITFLNEGDHTDADVVCKRELANRCREAVREYGLSAREEEVLFLLVQGKSNGDIEQELFISSNTVKTHIKHIYRKLDIHSREELVASLSKPF